MRGWFHIALAAGGMAALTACDRLGEVLEDYEQVTLEPLAVGTRDDMVYEAGGGPWCGVSRSGLASTIPEPDADAGEVLLGYDGFDDRGTPPFPCPELAVHQFDGAARFDVSGLPRDAANPLLAATLTAQRRATPVPNNPGCETAFAEIQRATAEWEPGLRPGLFSTAPGPRMWCEASAAGELTCNVSNLVRQWISGTTPNNGLVLRSIRHRAGTEIYFADPTCAFYYDDLRLEVQFLREDA